MANGRPGDHPFTDLVQYDANLFGPEIDSRIRDLAKKAAGSPLLERLVVLVERMDNAHSHEQDSLESELSILESEVI